MFYCMILAANFIILFKLFQNFSNLFMFSKSLSGRQGQYQIERFGEYWSMLKHNVLHKYI